MMGLMGESRLLSRVTFPKGMTVRSGESLIVHGIIHEDGSYELDPDFPPHVEPERSLHAQEGIPTAVGDVVPISVYATLSAPLRSVVDHALAAYTDCRSVLCSLVPRDDQDGTKAVYWAAATAYAAVLYNTLRVERWRDVSIECWDEALKLKTKLDTCAISTH